MSWMRTALVHTAPLHGGAAEAVVAALPFPALLADVAGRVVAVNHALCAAAGAAQDDLRGEAMGRCWPFAASREPTGPLIRLACESGSQARAHLTDPSSGARLEVIVSPTDALVPRGGVLVVVRDVTSDSRKMRRLHRRLDHMTRVMAALPVSAVVVQARTGVVAHATGSACDLLGVPGIGRLVGSSVPAAVRRLVEDDDDDAAARVMVHWPGRFGVPARTVSVRRARTVDVDGERLCVLELQAAHSGGEEISSPPADSLARVHQLSPRRLTVLRLLMGGAGTEAIAEHLVLSEYTVRNHISAILRLLGCGGRVAAVGLGFRAGLTPLRPS